MLCSISSHTTREALACAEALAPCVVRVDEMEKGLAQGDHDGGTSRRVFSTILHWMEEHTAPVFLVATVNSIENLPPELLRPGRCDAIFFLDLPTTPARKAILATHLKRRGRELRRFDLDKLAAASAGYTGAELALAVQNALYSAFHDRGREITTNDILLALQGIVPQSKSHSDKLAAVRQWIEQGRVLPASPPETCLPPPAKHPS